MKPIVANQPVNKQYEFKGVSTLVDGLKGMVTIKPDAGLHLEEMIWM